MDLTDKQERFAAEYIIDSNATQAAIRAGYAAGSADVTGSRLLGNARIQEAINKLRQPILVSAGLTLEAHLARLNALAAGAEKENQYAAAVSAEVSRGKAAGFYVTRTQEITPTDDELLELLERWESTQVRAA